MTYARVYGYSVASILFTLHSQYWYGDRASTSHWHFPFSATADRHFSVTILLPILAWMPLTQ